jgi:hypothetical protein
MKSRISPWEISFPLLLCSLIPGALIFFPHRPGSILISTGGSSIQLFFSFLSSCFFSSSTRLGWDEAGAGRRHCRAAQARGRTGARVSQRRARKWLRPGSSARRRQRQASGRRQSEGPERRAAHASGGAALGGPRRSMRGLEWRRAMAQASGSGEGASAGWRRWRVVQADQALGRSRLGVRRWRAGTQEVDAARLVRAGRRRQRVRANSAGADSRQAAAAAQAGA